MGYSSVVIIQVLDILTLCLLYSNNWEVKGLSGFLLSAVGYTLAFMPLPTGMVLRKSYQIKVLAIETRS
jgi:hypothetical protein